LELAQIYFEEFAQGYNYFKKLQQAKLLKVIALLETAISRR
jgi:hypothetical protein